MSGLNPPANNSPCILGRFGYNPGMDEQGMNPPEPATELRPLDHNGFFTSTFQMKRLVKGFMFSSELRERLDLDGLTIEPTRFFPLCR